MEKVSARVIFSRANLIKAFKDPRYAVMRGGALAAGKLYGKVRPYYALPPQTLTLFLTHRCNQRCFMCGLWGKNASEKHADRLNQTLSPDVYEELLAQFKTMKPTVCLFGGEPLLYPQLDKLLEVLVRRRFRSHMISNGLALNNHVQELAGRLDRLTLSINGAGKTHDDIVQVPGAFEKTMAGVEELKRIKKGKRPLLYMLVTITRENFTQLEGVVDQAEKIGFDGVTLQHLSYVESMQHTRHCAMVEQLRSNATDFAQGFIQEDSGIDPNRLWSKLDQILRRKRKTPVFQYPDFNREQCLDYYSERAFARFEHRRCQSPYHEVTIMPDGSVAPCMELSMGNILDAPFKDIWNNEEFRKFRKFIAQNTFPYCIRCCGLYRY